MTLMGGSRLGPYEILDLVGAGGMGEVYRARDPRLGREVAVKVLPADVVADPERLQRFEREARAVAALNHPNILTVYDVGTHEGAPYVVTELLQGETLRELVSRRAPTPRQVLGFAVQMAQGLAAAHAKGIVHRDVKPGNVFVTVDGRVKLLDFGLAKLVDRGTSDSLEETESSPSQAGRLLGTVGYMSPEQARAQRLDERTDLFSFGVVLYELLSGRHPFLRETAVGTLTAIVEDTPPELSSVVRGIPPAVSGIVRRCLEKEREQRFRTAHDLALSLEAVLQAPAGSAALEEVEERSPYPGLSSFTEKDAGQFFGREAEVKALWERLRSRHLWGVIGPSGAGKTSFVRAGVVASRPEGWTAIVCTPGAQPFRGLGQALVSQLAGDVEALERILSVDDPAVAFDLVTWWRRGKGEALLVVDQFEELFTLNPEEVQMRFTGLLGRLAREADVHVLLSLRDDFLMKCADHEPLARVFESLSPIPALSREGLCRALVEPARKRGYRFEDEALVAEMVESVEGARGALPLLAFAVSRLWEKRDREKKLLTRAAYEEIGGVAGALAQHAEATLDRIGSERKPIVREIFRNLVTSQGTRAVAEREELLSLFPERKAAEEVLRELVDARLLTSYEVEGREGEPSHHRIEVVHESLLKAWPRLVRWQAQEEDGAVLRDQLKQAAHLWEEKGRTSDLLWTGTAYQEYVLWRDRYAGALTAREEDFARAMAQRAQRQRRFRRLVAGSVVAAALIVAGVTGALWRRSEAAREQAKAEALRAEAGKLLALGRTHLEADPTAALAHARASLELFDTSEARRFAVEVLWHGPVARILPVERMARALRLPEDPSPISRIALSPDGRWLAASSGSNRRILIFSRDGGPVRALPRPPDGKAQVLAFGPRGDLLVTGGSGESLRFWALPDLREIRSAELGGLWSFDMIRGGRLFTFTRMHEKEPELLTRVWPLPDGEPKVLGRFSQFGPWDVDPSGTTVAYGRGRTVCVRPLASSRPSAERILGQGRDEVQDVTFSPKGDRLASLDRSGEIRVWSTDGRTASPLNVLRGPRYEDNLLLFDAKGRLLTQAGPNFAVLLWDLEGPPDTQPVVLGRPVPGAGFRGAFDPGGQWLATSYGIDTIEFWPLGTPWTRAIRGLSSTIWSMGFTSDSRWLATCGVRQPARLWPLSAADGRARDLAPPEPCISLATHPMRGQVLVGTTRGEVLLFPTAGGPPRRLPGGWGGAAMAGQVAFDPLGRWALASPYSGGRGLKDPKDRVLRVWDLESGQERVYSVAHLTNADWDGAIAMGFAADGSLYAPLGKGGDVMRLTLPAESGGEISSETVVAAGSAESTLSRDGRLLLVRTSENPGTHNVQFEQLLLFDLARHTSRRITTHGTRLSPAAQLDPSGRVIVTGDIDGVVRAGPVTGEEPHLLLGHEGIVSGLAVSPDGRWIASATEESIRLWPMPDVTKPPLHTLPHAELMAKLDALTNLRVVRDASSSTGWKLDVGPFPGWKDVPTW